jgi:metal-responsive CopG/Arc/MetJ family transcriptional regulator
MEKEQLSLTHDRDQLRSQSQKQCAEIDELKTQNSGLSERVEGIRRGLEEKLKEAQGNHMRDRSRFETEVALLQQKKDYAEMKITEL